MTDLTQDEWRKEIANDDNAIILDVRTETEVEEGYIPGAENLDIMNAGAFMEGANKLDKTKNYYVYCRSGNRSVQACMILESIGFANTYNLLEGFSRWDGETSL